MAAEKSLRTIITFQSTAFNTSNELPHFINPGCYGEDLCLYLAEKFQQAGWQCQQPGQEDFGWYLNFTCDADKYCLVCGFRPGQEEALSNQENTADQGLWIIQIEHAVGFLASIFGGRNRNIDSKVLEKMGEILAACPELTNLRWHLAADFNKGKEDLGTKTVTGL